MSELARIYAAKPTFTKQNAIYVPYHVKILGVLCVNNAQATTVLTAQLNPVAEHLDLEFVIAALTVYVSSVLQDTYSA